MGTKRYFWLKLPGDFFEKTEIRLIEKAPNGKELVLLYLKLLCKSIDSNGYLLFNGKAYNEEIISMITDTDIDIVKTGLALFERYGLIDKHNNTYFMTQIVEMMASETHWAEYKRKQRERQDEHKLDIVQSCPNMSNECQENVPLLREDIEIDIDKDIDKEDFAEQGSTPPYGIIIDYLNQKTNSHYKSTTKATQSKIKARMKEGATVEDFKMVIDLKSTQWMGDRKMEAFLRPETLFSASHFESYLNEAKRGTTPPPTKSDISQRLAAEVSVELDGDCDFD